MAGNGDSIHSTIPTIATVVQVRISLLIGKGPSVDPGGIGEKGRSRWLCNAGICLKHQFVFSVWALRVHITVDCITPLKVCFLIRDRPRLVGPAPTPSHGQFWAKLRSCRANSNSIDSLIPAHQPLHPKIGPRIVIDRLAFILNVHEVGQAYLLEVAYTLNVLSFDFRLGKGGQKHARQNRDDSNDNQEFNERKRTARAWRCRIRK